MGEGPPDLSPGAHKLIDATLRRWSDGRDPGEVNLGLNQWLVTFLERFSFMAAELAQDADTGALLGEALERIEAGDVGELCDAESIRTSAIERAEEAGKARVFESDIGCVLLERAGITVKSASPGREPKSTAGAGARWSAKATPLLDRYGRDLTAEARNGALLGVVGREREIRACIETLCRRSKRNPALVGPAGVGKTAIAEGLAVKIAAGDVPDLLRDVRLVALQLTVLVADTGRVGELEARVEGLLVEASQPGVILFIDEVHSVVGAGGPAGSRDVATLLKPALARGEIACIAATTDDEFRRYIEPDTALARRFQTVRVDEPDDETTRAVLEAHRVDLERLRSVRVDDDVIGWLVQAARQYIPNRAFPDKAVDLLEQCVANAVANGEAQVHVPLAREVLETVLGMPLDVDTALDDLETALSTRDLIPSDIAADLTGHLRVTLRGLDWQPERPNAVVLLCGEAASAAAGVARRIADILLGAADRVVTIDLSQIQTIWALIGSAPGYVGYQDSVPLQRVAQTPWCVLHLDGTEAAVPEIRDAVAEALTLGFIRDGSGRPLHLRDTVAVLSADIDVSAKRRSGFRVGDSDGESQDEEDVEAAIKGQLGPDLARVVDVVCARLDVSDDTRRRFAKEAFLPELARRFEPHGIDLDFDASFVDWVAERPDAKAGSDDWADLADDRLGPLLIPFVDTAAREGRLSVRLLQQNGEVRAERTDGPGDTQAGSGQGA